MSVSQVLRLRTLDQSPVLAIDNSPVSQLLVASTKSLGVHVNEDLSWNTHITIISKKVASGIGALKRCHPFVPWETLICAYNSIIQPHFDYCDIVWNNCGPTNATKPQRLQNHAARILTYSDYNAEVKPLFQQLNWTQLARHRELHTVNTVYKCAHGLAHLQDRFVNHVSNYFLRDSSNKFNVPLPCTNYLKKSFRYGGAVLWNGLHLTLQQAESRHSFKSGCKEFFK